MARWLSIVVRSAVVVIVMLCIATVTARPLSGQQAADSVPQAAATVSPASSAGADLSGPRVRPDFQRVEPTIPGGNASSSAAVASHTFTITTLALVLVVIILVLLVAD